MINSVLSRRIELAVSLLDSLKEVNIQLEVSASEIEESSGNFHHELFKNSLKNIQSDIDKYKSNIEKFKQLNYDITSKMNSWFVFSKDPDELKSLFFPIKYHIKKRQLKKNIKEINNEIYNMTILNRLIRENISNWEKEVEIKSIQQMKRSNNYTNYEQLISAKNELLTELRYLLPTLPITFPVQLDLRNIDRLIGKFECIETEL